MKLETGLQLSLHQYGRSSQEFFRISWPSDRPLVWATVLSNIPKFVTSINTEVVMAATPPRHRVYFAAATTYDNDILKPILKSNGDFYREKFDVRGEIPVFLGKKPTHKGLTDFFLGREARVREKWAFIYASTQSREVISNLFAHYQFEYGSLFNFPLAISEDEPRDWMPQFEAFFISPSEGKFGETLIKQSYCVMATYWEHGMELVSNKITPTQVKDIAQAVANKHGLELKVKES